MSSRSASSHRGSRYSLDTPQPVEPRESLARGIFGREYLRLDGNFSVEFVFLAPGKITKGQVERLDLHVGQQVEFEQDPVDRELAPLVAGEELELLRPIELGLGDEPARPDE